MQQVYTNENQNAIYTATLVPTHVHNFEKNIDEGALGNEFPLFIVHGLHTFAL